MAGNVFKFSVNYEVEEKVSGSTKRVKMVGDGTRGLVRTFADKGDAYSFFQKFKNNTLPNFYNITELDIKNGGVLMDGGTFDMFDPNQSLKSSIWMLSQNGRTIIAMSNTFIKLFKGIRNGLRALHKTNWYHGRLSKGILLSRQFDVKLFNVADQKLAIKDGIEKDLKSLRKLVRKVIKNNPHPVLPVPGWISLFEDFNDLFTSMTIHPTIGVDKHLFHAYFMFNHPIFADRDDRMILMHKFVNLRIICDLVDKVLQLRKGLADMGDWWLRLPGPDCFLGQNAGTNLHSFLIVTPSGDPRKPILGFFGDCIFHKGRQSSTKASVDEIAIDNSLLEVFPDFLPKVYYEFVRLLANTEFKDRTLYNSYIAYFQEALPIIPH